MSLSKPVYDLLGTYFSHLHNNPIRTKSLTSCVIAVLGNLISQYLSGAKVINQDSLIAFGLFGLLFGGSIPHVFYRTLATAFPSDTPAYIAKQLFVERLLYTPLYQALALYMIARFEGRSHHSAVDHLARFFWPLLKTNWVWLTIFHYLNLRIAPPMLQVLMVNLISFFWCVYFAKKRRGSTGQSGNKQ